MIHDGWNRRHLVIGILAAPAILASPWRAAAHGLGHRYKFGIYVGNNARALFAFERWFGHQVDVVLGYSDNDPGWQVSMPEYLGGTGREIVWSINMWPENAGMLGMRAAAAGRRNRDYRLWADRILTSRLRDTGPIYVRTSWELGGEWFPWTALAREDPEAYRRAFQQFSSSFKAVSPRFRMVWDVAGDRGPVEQWYPGDEACDVLSQDVYWNAQWSDADPVRAFEHCRRTERGLDWLTEFAARHNKPMAVTEWGTTGADGDAGGGFITAMKSWLDSNRVVYAIYWNGGSDSGYDGALTQNRWPRTETTFKRLFAPPVR